MHKLKAALRIYAVMCASAFTVSVHAQSPAAFDDGCIKGNFDRAVKVLPAEFCGNNWRDVLKAVQGLPMEKDKYESSAQHTARIQKTLEKPLYAAVSGTGTLAIVRRLQPKYDADKGQYQLYVPNQMVPFLPYAGANDRYKTVLEIDSWNGASSSYAGQNAYGATREITKKAEQTILLDSTKTHLASSQHINFRIPAADAKKLDGHVLAFLYIGKIAPPYFVMATESITPTIDNPVERSIKHAIIGFANEETWLFDVQTGQILSKKIKLTR